MTLNQMALEQLRKDVGEEVFPLILGQFREELTRQHSAVAQAVEQHDHTALAESAHSLKSTARTIGLDELADAAARTEQLCRAGEAAGVTEAQRLIAVCAQAQAMLQGVS
ncbi:MAG: Hpt domain-containing protein [Oceanococcaceae bacterium]